jgi:hypothetical protein
MRDQIAEFVHRAALNEEIRPQTTERLLEPRRAVDDGQLRPLQTTHGQIVERRAPSRFALSAHAANRKQNFLTIATYSKHDKH